MPLIYLHHSEHLKKNPVIVLVFEKEIEIKIQMKFHICVVESRWIFNFHFSHSLTVYIRIERDPQRTTEYVNKYNER